MNCYCLDWTKWPGRWASTDCDGGGDGAWPNGYDAIAGLVATKQWLQKRRSDTWNT